MHLVQANSADQHHCLVGGGGGTEIGAVYWPKLSGTGGLI